MLNVRGRFIFLLLALLIISMVITTITKSYKFKESFSGGGPDYKANDPVFDNAQFYQLDLNTTDEVTGYPLCLRECKGVCVQYGVTGSAWCIPNDFDVPPVKNGGTNLTIPKFTT